MVRAFPRGAYQAIRYQPLKAPTHGIHLDLLASFGERLGQKFGALGVLTQQVQHLEV
jgi:hypothetical protein